jgi:hypothetical protein
MSPRFASGQSTAKIAAAVISANTSHKVIKLGHSCLGYPRGCRQVPGRAYITPYSGKNEQDQSGK